MPRQGMGIVGFRERRLMTQFEWYRGCVYTRLKVFETGVFLFVYSDKEEMLLWN